MNDVCSVTSSVPLKRKYSKDFFLQFKNENIAVPESLENSTFRYFLYEQTTPTTHDPYSDSFTNNSFSFSYKTSPISIARPTHNYSFPNSSFDSVPSFSSFAGSFNSPASYSFGHQNSPIRPQARRPFNPIINKFNSRSSSPNSSPGSSPEASPYRRRSSNTTLCKLVNIEYPHRAESAYTVKNPEAKVDLVIKQVKGILNKITPEKYDTLICELKELLANSESNREVIQGVIGVIFEKALLEPNFSAMYAKICADMAREEMNSLKMTDMAQCIFRRLLLERCQKEFEKGSENDKIDRTKSLRRKTNNIKFVGELFKKHMLTEAIMKRVISDLIYNGHYDNSIYCPPEDDIEVLTKLITVVGEMLDLPSNTDWFGSYMKRLELLANDSTYSHRVRFLLLDVVELRLNKWVPRKTEIPASKLADLGQHIEAVNNRKKQERVYHSPSSGFCPITRTSSQSPPPSPSFMTCDSQIITLPSSTLASLLSSIKSLASEFAQAKSQKRGTKQTMDEIYRLLGETNMTPDELHCIIVSELMTELCTVPQEARRTTVEQLLTQLHSFGQRDKSGIQPSAFRKGLVVALVNAIINQVLEDVPLFMNRFSAALSQFYPLASDIKQIHLIVMSAFHTMMSNVQMCKEAPDDEEWQTKVLELWIAAIDRISLTNEDQPNVVESLSNWVNCSHIPRHMLSSLIRNAEAKGIHLPEALML